jgi:ATP-dependent helicase/nuclease subunit A
MTRDQQAAVLDRSGSSLLAANAGSGKTAVMVERFVEAVRVDGVPVGSMLALTFTEKAAGELRERVRRRLLELGEAEHARSVDAAWIGTIHGFCARVLRARPLAAGLDPRFEVLDEPAATRLAERAYEEALDAWAAAQGAPAVDLAAAYGVGLRDLILGAHDVLRSRGAAHPRLPVPPQAARPDAAALAAARGPAAASLVTAGAGKRVSEGREALDACERFLAGLGDRVPLPGELDVGRLGAGAKALTVDACAEYRDAWEAYRKACADHHARSALALLDTLLDRFGTTYAAAKAARAGLDFEDLELYVRELLADPGERRRWSERFALIMVDEFQDTNRLQLDLLEALERSNLFAVGDEFQSIYRFRHADVSIFRERRAKLDAERVRGLAINFRSAEELLDVLNAAFAAELGERFRPLVAGRTPEPAMDPGGALRLFDPDPPAGEPPAELMITHTKAWEEVEVGLAGLADQTWRRAEARALAHRLREEVAAGRRPGDIVVLVRATASLRLFEQALEEQGLPTYVVGGRGYWSQEQVRDALAYLAALANPRDAVSLYGALASPFCGVGSDALILLAEAGRAGGRGPWAALRDAALGRGGPAHGPVEPDGPSWIDALAPADRDRLLAFARFFAGEREAAERLPVEAMLERGIAGTGYDLAILKRAGGERRLANLRKLMRLARDYEHAEGRDLRGFITFAAAQDLAEAREGEAPLESDGLDAVRLMTIHRAKGLEFPVVCVADLGRLGVANRPRLLLGRGGEVGLRLAALGGGDPVPALEYDRLAAEEDEADAEEERRLFYVAMTRARERLILSGGTDCEKWPAPRPGGAPIDWIVRALVGDPHTLEWGIVERAWDGRPARVVTRLNVPATLPPEALAPAPRARSGAATTHLPKQAAVVPVPPARPRPAPQRLSYSSLQDYARCGYRFYLRRILQLPPEEPPPLPPEETTEDAGLEARLRGSLVHALLEELDFASPAVPAPGQVAGLAELWGAEVTPEDVEDVAALVASFAGSSLCARLAAAHRVRREAGFVFALEPSGDGPLVNGFVDVLAEEPGGGVLVVDYKSHRLEGADPAEIVERDYSAQQAVYALAALKNGAPEVSVAHCFLERPDQPITASYTRADIPALTERVLALARGMLDDRYPVTDRPHRDLCAECPGRRALCSHPESRTLAPEPASYASAGSLAGSGGPS